MKQFLTLLFVCGAAFAQTKSTASTTKSTAAKSTTAAKAPAAAATTPAVFKAKFATTQGDFIVQVTRAWAPLGADRFYALVRQGFFTGAPLFRVIPGFMAQFGVSPDPKVSALWSSRNLKDDPVTQSNKRSYITFATAGPNTRTTQLFINYKDNTFLDSQGFAPFGEVIEGMEVVEKFYSGYGDTASQGGTIQQLGKPWLDKNMPKLDSIKTAVIVTATPLAATKSTTSTATKSTAAKSTKSTAAPKATTATKQ